MKVEYKAGRPEDDLTVGKKYDVIDIKCKKGFEVSEVFLKNDKAQDHWYGVGLFIMYAEATAAMRTAAADAAMTASALATPEQQAVAIKIEIEPHCGNITDTVEKLLEKTKRDAHLMYGA